MFNEIRTNTNLRWYFTGRFISSIGNHFSFFAQSVAAYHFTGTLTAVGILWLVRGIASILLIPFGGILADRFPRKRLMLTTDMISGLLTLCFIFVNHGNQFWLLPLLASLTQAVQRIYDPAAKASFKKISDPTPLKVSGSVSALLSQVAVIAGPLLAGFLYFITNESLQMLFILDAFSFFISFLLLLQVDFKDTERQKSVHGKSLLLDGFHFIFHNSGVRSLLLLIFPIAWTGKIFDVMVLDFSNRMNSNGLHSLGILLAIFAAGGIIGSLFIPKLHNRILPTHLVKMSGFTLCLLLMLVAQWLHPVTIGVFSFFFGGVLTATMTSLQIVIQERVADEFLGRVFAGWSLIAVTGGGIGAFLVGWMLDSLTIRTGLILISLITLIPLLAFTFRFPKKTHQRAEEFF